MLGVVVCLFLIAYTSLTDKLIGIGVILLGIPIFYFFSNKMSISRSKESLILEGATFVRTIESQDNFLAHLLSHLRRTVRKHPE